MRCDQNKNNSIYLISSPVINETCRQTTSNEKLGRIFFDIAFSVEVDSADLQQKLDETSLEFQVVQKELREVRQENLEIQREMVFLEEEASHFEIQQSLEFQVVQQKLREVRQENVTLKEKSNKYEKERLDRELVIRQLGTELSILQQRVAFLNKQEEELQSELNTTVQLKQKADEELRKCRRLLSTFRLELQQTKKELKEKEEEEEKSSLAEELIEIYTAENAKLKEKLKALTESISSPCETFNVIKKIRLLCFNSLKEKWCLKRLTLKVIHLFNLFSLIQYNCADQLTQLFITLWA
jgi:chromosome segregation ATPase